MKESELERIFVNEVRREGGEAYKWVSPGNTGVPDRIVVFPGGGVYFVELKTQRGTVRPIQWKQLNRLKGFGLKVDVVKGGDGMVDFFEAIGRRGASARLLKRFGEGM